MRGETPATKASDPARGAPRLPTRWKHSWWSQQLQEHKDLNQLSYKKQPRTRIQGEAGHNISNEPVLQLLLHPDACPTTEARRLAAIVIHHARDATQSTTLHALARAARYLAALRVTMGLGDHSSLGTVAPLKERSSQRF